MSDLSRLVTQALLDAGYPQSGWGTPPASGFWVSPVNLAQVNLFIEVNPAAPDGYDQLDPATQLQTMAASLATSLGADYTFEPVNAEGQLAIQVTAQAFLPAATVEAGICEALEQVGFTRSRHLNGVYREQTGGFNIIWNADYTVAMISWMFDQLVETKSYKEQVAYFMAVGVPALQAAFGPRFQVQTTGGIVRRRRQILTVSV